MSSKKIFIFLPDGVGLRNFALTNFNQIGKKLGFEIVYWNNTPFEIEAEIGYQELKITNNKLHPLTTVFTRARKRSELNLFDKNLKKQYTIPIIFRNPIKDSKTHLKVCMLIFS
ncbi:hypothetical protein [Flavobacterium davisii]|uniref:hypothetical protein n=1 Tax=Flavobacterium davisii TaxID=2906077 RepID=UPI002869B92A|nr:hypothetical protein [Flavobacterium davisii]